MAKTKIATAQGRVSSAATYTYTPSAGEVLRGLTAAQKTELARSIARERGIDVATKEGKQKASNIRRTIERQTTTKGAQKRGAVKGLTSEYSNALKKEFKEKFKPVKQKKFKPAKIAVRANYKFYANDNRHRQITFDLTEAQVEAFAEAENEDDAVAVLLSSAPNTMEDAEVSNIKSVLLK